jgi:uncharacterized protein
MAENSGDQEPSIEEILASIREIISDDDQPAKEPEAAAPEPAPAPEPEPVAEVDDILDLAAFAEAPKPVEIPAEDSADPLAGIDFDKPTEQTVDFTDPLAEVVPEPEPEPIAASMPDLSSTATVDTDSLLSNPAQSASLDSLTRLAQNFPRRQWRHLGRYRSRNAETHAQRLA